MAVESKKIDVLSRGYDPTMRPPPGYSLTLPPGNAPYEKPPKFSKSSEFIDYIDDKLSSERAEEEVMNTLAMGTSIQHLTETIIMTSFMQGEANPDVLENSKPEIFVNILSRAMDFFDIGEDDEIPFRMFETSDGSLQEDEDRMDNTQRMKITESLNPVAAKAFKASQEEDKRARSKEAVEKMAENLTRMRDEEKRSSGFLGVNAEGDS